MIYLLELGPKVSLEFLILFDSPNSSTVDTRCEKNVTICQVTNHLPQLKLELESTSSILLLLLLHTATSPHHIHVSTASLVNSKQMRKIKPSSLLRTSHHVLKYSPPTRQCPHHPPILSPCRSLAQLQTTREIFPEIWFTSSSPPLRAPAEISQSTNGPPPDERTLKLGKSTSSRPPLRSRNTDKHPPQL